MMNNDIIKMRILLGFINLAQLSYLQSEITAILFVRMFVSNFLKISGACTAQTASKINLSLNQQDLYIL